MLSMQSAVVAEARPERVLEGQRAVAEIPIVLIHGTVRGQQ
jgi:hypothetical protein